MSSDVQKHYDKLAEIYNDLWFYSDDFVLFLTERIVSSLAVEPADRLVDLGCGTGIYAKKILQMKELDQLILGIDPSLNMLKQVKKEKGIVAIKDDAVSFSARSLTYDKVLIKEVIHHVDPSTWPELFVNLYNHISAAGRLLLLMLPPTINYPLFDAAITRYEKKQPHYSAVASSFREAGFETSISMVDYPLSISRDRYVAMVRNRYMSLLSDFTDKEIEQGAQEIEERYNDKEILEFQDRFVFILGRKGST